MDFNDFLIWALSLWIGVAAILFFRRRLQHTTRRKLPPGPTGLPIVGSLFKLGNKPNESLARLAMAHGPLMTLPLGSVTAVVASSANMAKEVLQKHDQAFSGRFVLDGEKAMAHNEVSLAWLPAGLRWRNQRRVLNTQLLSTQRLDDFQALRTQKVHQLLDYVRHCSMTGQAVNIGRSAFVTSPNMISSTLFSLDVVDINAESGQDFKDLIWGVMENVGKPNPVDYFPVLRFLDPRGIRRYMTGFFKKLYGIFDELIDKRLQSRASTVKRHNDLLDALLDRSQEPGSELTRPEIRAIFVEMFIAGTDTNTTVVEWAMAELLRSPAIMEKARQEIKETIGCDRNMEESDIPRLPYLQAVVKEVMRLHPPSPLLLPHTSETDVEVAGFTVPKRSQVIVNAWAISRDPENWNNPNSFVPERFLGASNIDFRGQDFTYIPFGAGRRICPGLSLAHRMILLTLASLVQCFAWKLPDGMSPGDLDMSDKFGVTLQKAVPLLAVPVNHHVAVSN